MQSGEIKPRFPACLNKPEKTATPQNVAIGYPAHCLFLNDCNRILLCGHIPP
jgi:hypothetical protein